MKGVVEMNLKKKIALLLSIVLVITSVFCVCFHVFANDEIHFTFDENTKTLTLTGSGRMDDYSQDTFNQVEWSAHKNNIVNIVIGEGITHIGDYTFCRETSLENVTLPSSLKSIGAAAFAGNDKLMDITVPDSVNEIGDYAFGYNYDMTLNKDFVAYCAFNSTAQQYCIKNYIAFDTPFAETKSDTAVILGKNWQSMWSFVPQTDGILTFWSTGTSDTFGLIYDADNYVYNSSFNIMKKSALAFDDDSFDDNVNFKVSYAVQAGHRYYLAAKYRSEMMDKGSFDVHITFECTKHLYEQTIITQPTCINDGEIEYTCSVCGYTYKEKLYAFGHSYVLSSFSNGIAGVQCESCDAHYEIPFIDYVNKSNPILDVVNDNVINAKDYSRLIKMFK